MTDNAFKQFCIVEFPVDKTIEVVPRTWLSENNKKCAFPENRPKDKFDRANEKAKKLLKASYSSDFGGESIQTFEPPINDGTEQEVESIPLTLNYYVDRITTLTEEYRGNVTVEDRKGFSHQSHKLDFKV
ncbi:hypothetical protein Fcan01_08880 [Folsomia candida]|uniref:Uncharacterized protein n=1 Tax=Folsomia candida TaxID=158441 RepID=A0A226EGS7_FOLCA|nr:hypothetical protein Fcan01_08880 [Folsomia candida]